MTEYTQLRTFFFTSLFSLSCLLDGAITSRVNNPFPREGSIILGDTSAFNADGFSESPSISGDGRYVAYKSAATNLVPGDTNFGDDIFLYDRDLRTTKRVSLVDGEQIPAPGVISGVISPDGQFVLFSTLISDPVTFASTTFLYLYDVKTGQVENEGFLPDGSNITGFLLNFSMSADGRFIVFEGPTDQQIYRRDIAAGETILVSENLSGEPAEFGGHAPSISGDGRYVVFQSSSGDLVAEGVGESGNVFLRDLENGATTAVVVNLNGELTQNVIWAAPSINADGTHVAFKTDDPNLVPGDNNNSPDVFLYEIASSEITMVSLRNDGLPSEDFYDHNGADATPMMSPTARFVVFASNASDLVDNDRNGVSDIFLRDRETGRTSRVNVSSRGREANTFLFNNSFGISNDGKAIVFAHDADNFVFGDTNQATDIFLRDTEGFANNLQSFGPLGSNPTNAYGKSSQPSGGFGLPQFQVNTSTLNLTLFGTLFAMNTRGPSISIDLTYNAEPSLPPGMFGPSWRLGYESSILLSFDGQTVTLCRGNGQVLTYHSPEDLNRFDLVPPIAMEPPDGYFDLLSYHGDHWLLQFKESRTTYRYDEISPGAKTFLLTGITDRNGNELTFVVDMETGKIESVADPADRTILFTYNVDGRVSRIDTPSSDSRSLLFNYDDAGNLEMIQDLAGNQGRYLYDEENYLVRMTHFGRQTDFEYLARGRGAGKYLVKVKDGLLGETRYEITSLEPLIVDRSSREGRANSFEANGDGRVERISDPLGNVRNIAYDKGLPMSITDENGNTLEREYDARGNVITTTDALGRKSVFTYDEMDNKLTATGPSPFNDTYRFFYDDNGNVIQVRTPLGAETNFSYDKFGQLTEVADANGNTTSYEYDDFGNLTAMADAENNITAYEYDNAGLRLITITDPAGNEKHLTHDRLDRLTKVGYGPIPGEPQIRFEYDAFKQTAYIDEKGARTAAFRNKFSRITKITDPVGNSVTYLYDADNNRIAIISPLGLKTFTIFDVDNRPVRITDPMGFQINNLYDKKGNLTRVTDQRSKATKFTYDKNNRLFKTEDPLGRSTLVARDELGRISEVENARGQRVSFIHDEDGRLIRKDFSGAMEGEFTYDPVGNLLTMNDSSGTTTYTYNALNKVSTITFPDNNEVAFTYNELGRIETITYPGGETVAYAYDDFNRLPIPSRWRLGVSSQVTPSERPNRITQVSWGSRFVNYAYDAKANMLEESRSNGTVTTYAYDPVDRPLSIVASAAESALLSLFYSYDAASKTVSEIAEGGIAPELQSATITATYNAANEIMEWNGEGFSYDLDGNLAAVDSSGFSASYDEQNRPTRITRDGITVSYTYDGNGKRHSKTVNGETVVYHYDHRGRLLFESDEPGAVLSNYIYKGNVIVARGTEASGYVFYHFNKGGNTMALTDDGGGVTIRYAYLPYGTVTRSGPSVGNPFTFVGAAGVIDDGSDLFFMKNRYYDARIRRFIHRDPLGIKGGLNLYAYGGGNPVDFVDPEGTFIISTLLAIGSIITAGTLGAEAEGAFADAERSRVTKEVISELSKRAVRGDPRALNRLKKWRRLAAKDDKDVRNAAVQLGRNILKEGIKAGVGGAAGGLGNIGEGAVNVVTEVGDDQGFFDAPKEKEDKVDSGNQDEEEENPSGGDDDIYTGPAFAPGDGGDSNISDGEEDGEIGDDEEEL